MLEHERQHYLAILERYHIKVNRPEYVIRKRGNPPSVLKAVMKLRGTKSCARCGFSGYTQLHHVDGNWRNYQFTNLQYHCRYCHSQAHKELFMNTRNMWTEELRSNLRAQVDAGVQKGKTKREMYETLAPKYNVTAKAAEAAYRYDREQAAKYARRARERQQNGIASVRQSTPVVRQNTSGPVTMTAEEAIQFFRWQREMNITII